ncbi:MAG: nuclear transport factor 2 family protein [Anaerolineales bacterium]|nr:nuclear transport factor 2 family protein [Anaerolineales bacterium]
MDVENRLAIQELIAKFATSFDLKDWGGLQACFTETFRADYSDMNGAPPQTVIAAEYAQSRREMLKNFKLHHLVSNYEIDFADSKSATCRASMIVWRKSEAEQQTAHCFYIFQLTKESGDWKIYEIAQKIFWNEQA